MTQRKLHVITAGKTFPLTASTFWNKPAFCLSNLSRSYAGKNKKAAMGFIFLHLIDIMGWGLICIPVMADLVAELKQNISWTSTYGQLLSVFAITQFYLHR